MANETIFVFKKTYSWTAYEKNCSMKFPFIVLKHTSRMYLLRKRKSADKVLFDINAR